LASSVREEVVVFALVDVLVLSVLVEEPPPQPASVAAVARATTSEGVLPTK
jgi:hypothetical protein